MDSTTTVDRPDENDTGTPPPSTGSSPPPPPSRRRGLSWRSYVAVAAVGALGAAAVVVPTQLLDDDTTTGPEATSVAADASQDATAPSGEGSGTQDEPAQDEPLPGASDGTMISEIAARVSPSVVRVDVSGAQGSGSGSGVAYDAQGHVLTNNHVVDGADDVRITSAAGERIDAEIVGTDPASDIAVLKVADDSALPVPAFADAEPEVGERAVAIGSPFGLDGSVTAGIVSALDRQLQGPNAPLVGMIQTDAAINPGNSGGALVDGQARIIGINTAIVSGGGGNDGIGFAVPIELARDVADQLIADGEVSAGYLGVSGQTVDPQVAELYGLMADRGAVIAQVEPGSPAEEADLQVGDIVVGIAGEEVDSMTDLAAAVRRVEPGQDVELDIIRRGEEQTVTVTVGERPTGG